MLTFAIPLALIGFMGQVQPGPIKLPRTEYRVPSYPGTFLLSWGLVQDEIGIPEEVRKDLQQARQVHDDRIKQMMVPSYPVKTYKDPLTPAHATALNKISASHKKRLGEIYLQYYDVSAVADPYVAKLIGLSESQRQFAQQRLTAAHRKHQDAQEAMFETFRKDSEILQKTVNQTPVSMKGGLRGYSYVVPRDVQNRHTDLTRRTALIRTREMAKAREEIRANLAPAQLANLKRFKGKPISQYFYDGSNWGTAQPHPDLVLNINVQAEMGFSLKQHLEILKESRALKSSPRMTARVISRLTESQKAILRQYELQYDREYSILRHDVATQLNLGAGVTDRIRLRLEELEVEAHRKADLEWVKLDGPQAQSQAVSSNRGAILEECDRNKRKAILYFLSAQQRNQWKEMIGTPLQEIQPGRGYG
ncbi:MAG: hypothetical protein H7Y17_01000 [Chlorobia bacterium]|nr:hypothetical protein [Fimbriimonadaceae bacterium]